MILVVDLIELFIILPWIIFMISSQISRIGNRDIGWKRQILRLTTLSLSHTHTHSSVAAVMYCRLITRPLINCPFPFSFPYRSIQRIQNSITVIQFLTLPSLTLALTTTTITAKPTPNSSWTPNYPCCYLQQVINIHRYLLQENKKITPQSSTYTNTIAHYLHRVRNSICQGRNPWPGVQLTYADL
jgi:hypothetical protein